MKRSVFVFVAFVFVVVLACERSNPVYDLSDETGSQSTISILQNTSEGTIVFGPQEFKSDTGKPVTEEVEFTIENPANEFKLILENGGEGKNSQVTSCFVILNGDTIVYPIDVDKETEKLEMDVSLLETNLLTVRVAGKPGSYVNITITELNDCPCTVIDIDGNVYQTVKIGDQCWMAENLKVTHYSNGDSIPNVINDSEWSNLSTGAYCNYNNDENNVTSYGRLYNWFAVDDSRNIAPAGWHVPSDAEWKELEMYLGMSQSDADGSYYRGTDEGGKLKETGTTHWISPNTGATNESGFSALPGGYRGDDGSYSYIGCFEYFWFISETNSTEAWYRELLYNYSEIYRGMVYKVDGYSIRCVKN
ncbi:fibrobacter succinogenes major paralogous domain-containing protein [candidate division KSB1 bacterium]|nr:fibrobacter succinogenes major paralogous domain-containing protein [candidate division KSB1 bacterium]